MSKKRRGKEPEAQDVEDAIARVQALRSGKEASLGLQEAKVRLRDPMPPPKRKK